MLCKEVLCQLVHAVAATPAGRMLVVDGYSCSLSGHTMARGAFKLCQSVLSHMTLLQLAVPHYVHVIHPPLEKSQLPLMTTLCHAGYKTAGRVCELVADGNNILHTGFQSTSSIQLAHTTRSPLLNHNSILLHCKNT